MKKIITLLIFFLGLSVACSYGAADKPAGFNKGHLLRGIPVVTSPYLGDRSHFEALDLITNISPVNFDVRLLDQLKAAEDLFKKHNIPFPTEPMVDLSGKVEAQGSYDFPSKGKYDGNLDLVTAELDVLAKIHTWGNAFFTINYDAAPGNPAYGRRVTHSNFFLEQGFVTIGNFNRAPWYVTIGQQYVPFGMHEQNVISAPVTNKLGLLKHRAVVVGCKHSFIHASVFGFRSETKIKKEAGVDGGANLDLMFKTGDLQGKVGGSVVSNIAEVTGFQVTGLDDDQFKGFAATVIGKKLPAPLPSVQVTIVPGSSEKLSKRVVGFDVHGGISYKDFTFIGEAVFAGSRFSPSDLMHNTKGARPWGLNVEGVYTFKLDNIPMALSAGYGYTEEALVLGLPQHSIRGALTMAFWNSSIQAIEVKHDIDYSSSNVVGWNNGTGGMGTFTSPGISKTTVTVHFGFYF